MTVALLKVCAPQVGSLIRRPWYHAVAGPKNVSEPRVVNSLRYQHTYLRHCLKVSKCVRILHDFNVLVQGSEYMKYNNVTCNKGAGQLSQYSVWLRIGRPGD
jgi:hypothetical protein